MKGVFLLEIFIDLYMILYNIIELFYVNEPTFKVKI